MPNEEMPSGGRWQRREWTDPATVVGSVLGLVGVALILLDRLDMVLFAQAVDFSPWPELMLLVVVFWFFGIRLFRLGGPGE